MKFWIPCCFLILPITAVRAEPPTYWLCTNAAGYQIDQDEPCAEPQLQQIKTATDSAVRLTSEIVRPARRPAAVKQVGTGPAYGVEPLKPQALVFWALAFLGLAFVTLQPALASVSRRRATHAGRAAGQPKRIEPLLDRPRAPAVPPPPEWTPDLLQRLQPQRLAELCEGVWRLRGYRAISESAGGGAEIKLYSPAGLDQLLAVIRCYFGAEPVGVEPLRQFCALANRLDVRLHMFYSLAGFTAEARSWVAGKSLRLYSAPDLLEQVTGLPAGVRRTLLEHVIR